MDENVDRTREQLHEEFYTLVEKLKDVNKKLEELDTRATK